MRIMVYALHESYCMHGIVSYTCFADLPVWLTQPSAPGRGLGSRPTYFGHYGFAAGAGLFGHCGFAAVNAPAYDLQSISAIQLMPTLPGSYPLAAVQLHGYTAWLGRWAVAM